MTSRVTTAVTLSAKVPRLVILAAAAAASPTRAIEAQLLAGTSHVIKNDLLEADEGNGQAISLRLGTTLPGQPLLTLGLHADADRFVIASDDHDGTTRVERDGSLQGNRIGLELSLAPPWFVRPYWRFAAFAGSYAYEVDSQSNTADSETTTGTDVDLATSGLESSIGLAFGATLGVSVEYKETREIVQIRSISFQHASRVDGEAEAFDAGDQQVEDALQSLVGKRYGCATRSFLLGLFWSL